MGIATKTTPAATKTARFASVTWFGVMPVRWIAATTPAASGRITYVLKSWSCLLRVSR